MKKLLLIVTLSILSLNAAARSYGVVGKKSELGFSIEKFAIGKVISGTFKTYNGSADIENGVVNSLDGQVIVNSIDTDDEKRDKHLKSGDFFAAKNYPYITFKIKDKFNFKPGQEQRVTAKLTMKGKTKEAKFKIKVIQDPKGHFIVIGKSQVNRYDFGISWNKRQDKEESSILDTIASFAKGLGDKYVIDKNVDITFRMLLLPKRS